MVKSGTALKLQTAANGSVTTTYTFSDNVTASVTISPTATGYTITRTKGSTTQTYDVAFTTDSTGTVTSIAVTNASTGTVTTCTYNPATGTWV